MPNAPKIKSSRSRQEKQLILHEVQIGVLEIDEGIELLEQLEVRSPSASRETPHSRKAAKPGRGSEVARILAENHILYPPMTKMQKEPCVLEFRRNHVEKSPWPDLTGRQVDSWLAWALEQDGRIEGNRLTKRQVMNTRSRHNKLDSSIRVYQRGITAELASVVDELIQVYGCSRAQATIVTLVKRSAAGVSRVRSEFVPNFETSELSRIVVTAHPATSIEEVAREYKARRDKLGIKDVRPISDKKAALAEFLRGLDATPFSKETAELTERWKPYPERLTMVESIKDQSSLRYTWRSKLELWNAHCGLSFDGSPLKSHDGHYPDGRPYDKPGTARLSSNIGPRIHWGYRDLSNFMREGKAAMKAFYGQFSLTTDQMKAGTER